MKILISGATGFIGRNLVPSLLKQGHQLVCISRSEAHASTMPWFEEVSFVYKNLHEEELDHSLFNHIEGLIHLSWPGLPNYRDVFHLDVNLPYDMRFLRYAIECGVKRILVTGTCLEYGMKNGPLSEDDPCDPVVPYAIAKDTLRRYLEGLQANHAFILQWIRLFYVYGKNQGRKALLDQLDQAISNGDRVFNMSKGEQLRDFIKIDTAVEKMTHIFGNTDFNGIVNCCSGEPVSVRSHVERHLKASNSTIELNLGHYPYPDYEPMAFWGNVHKLESLTG